MSEIRANTISDAAGTGPVTLTKQSAAKAWALFDFGAANIDDSFNTSSYADTGVGTADIGLTNAFATVNMAIATNAVNAQPGAMATGNGGREVCAGSISTSAIKVRGSVSSTSAANDNQSNTVVIHGDLA